jgi:hypothetical protein
MISLVMSVRNNRAQAMNGINSMLRAMTLLQAGPVEYVLIDDNSDPQQQIPAMFEDVRRQVGNAARVVTLNFTQQQHYTRALAYGFSVAKGRHILFVSHDMLVTAEYVRTLLAVAASDSSIGLVRGTSPYVDCFPQHQIVPPVPIRSFDDLDAFARFVSQYAGLQWVEDGLLTGDSMLIKREALDKIGVLDRRYFGYFGDIDFGLRLQRAGFKMVCAKGAWLWHEGAGAYKDQAKTTGVDYQVIHEKRMQVVNEAYKQFREKWDLSMPPNYFSSDALPLDALRQRPPGPYDAFIAPALPDSSICRIS